MTFWRGNMSNVKEGGEFVLIPEGITQLEIFKIEETKSQAGDPMAVVDFHPVSGEFMEKEVRDYIVFPLPGSKAAGILGRSKKFLHAIGEPHEEADLAVDPSRWAYKKVYAMIKHEPFISKKTGKELKGAKIKYYLLPEEIEAEKTAWDEEGPEL